MDPATVGKNIAKLRKKQHLTQAQLAQILNVSDKTVSKWESGQGYPEIIQFPTLAKLFGVSVDDLMNGSQSGIAFAGNILVDVVKNVDAYPEVGMLASIRSVSYAVGGAVPNTAIDLSKIDRSIPLSAVGKVGNDDYGRYVVSQMQHYGIDTSFVTVSSALPTSFSDVINSNQGERTFFHARGANAAFSPEDVNLDALDCSILHIGYILLLDRFDEPDRTYGTVMARFLHDARERGIRTSVDVVSESSANYGKTILPALRYCSFLIVNEIEICAAWGLEPRKPDGKIWVANVRKAMQNAAACGVSEKVIVHCKEAGFCLDVASGAFTAVASLDYPRKYFKGSVGAGDAYCAGCLYAIYNGYEDRKMLEFASAAATCNLLAENSVDGMKPKSKIEAMMREYGRMQIDLEE